jgi:hypothetical protein
MSRTLPAVIGAILVFVFTIVAALLLGDVVQTLHWSMQALFFAVMGFGWVMPVRWIMLWSVHKR